MTHSGTSYEQSDCLTLHRWSGIRDSLSLRRFISLQTMPLSLIITQPCLLDPSQNIPVLSRRCITELRYQTRLHCYDCFIFATGKIFDPSRTLIGKDHFRYDLLSRLTTLSFRYRFHLISRKIYLCDQPRANKRVSSILTQRLILVRR